MARLFVSYARSDLPTVTALVGELREMGFEPFFDQELAGGQRWWNVLLDRIRDCAGFLPVLSDKYCESEACRREAEWAHALGIPFVPIDLGRIGPELCDPYIAEANWVRYSLDDRASLARLTRALNALPPVVLPSPLPERPPIPITYLAATRQEIRDSATLGPERQLAIITTLRTKLGTAEDNATRTLLTELRRRPDVTYDNALEIDRLLGSVSMAGKRSAAGPSASAARHRLGTHRLRAIAVLLGVLIVAIAVGVWVAVDHRSNSTGAAGGQTHTPPSGSHSMSTSASMSRSAPMSMPASTRPSAPPTPPMAGGLDSALVLADRYGGHRLPRSSCAVWTPTDVECTRPSEGVGTASFRIYPSVAAMYDAYEARVKKLTGGTMHTNVRDCSYNSYSGEIGWNHQKRHLRFSMSQSRSNMLDEDTQAAGRVFCKTVNNSLISVWTQNSGPMLAEIHGTPYPPAPTFAWWAEMHHQIAVHTTGMKMGS